MVVWAEVKDISAIWVGNSPEVVKSVDQFIEQGYVPVEIQVGRKGGEGSELYRCAIYPFSNAKESGEGNGRGIYMVDEITFESIDATIAEIEKSINKIWGRDYDEMSVKVSWYAIGEYEFIYEADEPVLNPDGTINYNPNAYMGNSFMAQGIEAAKKGLN